MRLRKGQSTFELSTMITIVLAVLLVMGVYFKRGVQGRWKASVDEIGEQYDPNGMNSSVTSYLSGETMTQVTAIPDGDGSWSMRRDLSNTIESKIGSSRVGSPP